jgi:hypothetical protein
MRLGISVYGSFSCPFWAHLFRRGSEISVIVGGVVRRLWSVWQTRAHIFSPAHWPSIGA